MGDSMRTLLTVVLLTSQLCSCQDDVILLRGDVMLGSMMIVNDVRGESCGDFSAMSLKGLTAVTWFLNQLNKERYIPGLTIGLHTYRTCKSSEMAARAAVRMMETYSVVDPDSHNNVSTPLLGLLGPTRTQEAEVVSRMLGSLPEEQRPLLISGSATGETLKDRALYPSFFRVIPPDSTQVDVLVELLAQLEWNYVAIVYDDDAYGRQAAHRLKQLADEKGICVPCFSALPLDYRSLQFGARIDTVVAKLQGSSASSPIKGVVFIGGSATAESFVERLSHKVLYVRFIFSEATGLADTALLGPDGVITLGKGALAASPPYFAVPEFSGYWKQLWQNRSQFLAEAERNPWLEGLYGQITNCDRIQDADCWRQNNDLIRKAFFAETRQNLFEYYNMKAVAVFAAVLKELHTTFCEGPGLCHRLKEELMHRRSEIQNVLESRGFDLEDTFSSITSAFTGQKSVRFDPTNGEIVTNKEEDSLYEVYNFQEREGSTFDFVQVGRYSAEHTLAMNITSLRGYSDNGVPLTWADFPRSQCMGGKDCLECLPGNIPGQVAFIPGDFYFIGVAPVHDRKAEGALLCGDIRTLTAADLVENILFAVDQVNAKKGPFSGIFGDKTLGVIVLDSCYRELVIKERLTQLYKGELMLPDGRNSSHILSQIVGVVGDYYSTTSIAVYEVLSKLGVRFVHVGPSNTSPLFSDKTVFPYFLRLITKQELFNTALFSLLREFNFTYIQVVYDPSDVYTSTVHDGIVTLSSHYNVCIAQSIPTKYEDNNMNPILDKMRKFSSASAVVVILLAQHVQKIMTQILPRMTSSDNFVFVGGTAWSRIDTAVQVERSERLIGTLTFSQELPVDIKFRDYFAEVDPLKCRNPWLKYFWEKHSNCYFPGSFLRKGKTGPCPRDITRGYKQDPWTPFFINSVYTLALGLDRAIGKCCQGNLLCDELTSAELRDGLKTVKLDLYNTGRPVKVFDDNGDGDIGYTIFEIVPGDPGGIPAYKKVGLFENGKLTLDNKNELLLVKRKKQSVCPDPTTCGQCFPPTHATDMCASSDRFSDNIGATKAAILIPCVIVIVILLISNIFLIALIVRRRRPSADKVSQELLMSVLAANDQPNHTERETTTGQRPKNPPPPPSPRNPATFPSASANQPRDQSNMTNSRDHNNMAQSRDSGNIAQSRDHGNMAEYGSSTGTDDCTLPKSSSEELNDSFPVNLANPRTVISVDPTASASHISGGRNRVNGSEPSVSPQMSGGQNSANGANPSIPSQRNAGRGEQNRAHGTKPSDPEENGRTRTNPHVGQSYNKEIRNGELNNKEIQGDPKTTERLARVPPLTKPDRHSPVGCSRGGEEIRFGYITPPHEEHSVTHPACSHSSVSSDASSSMSVKRPVSVGISSCDSGHSYPSVLNTSTKRAEDAGTKTSDALWPDLSTSSDENSNTIVKRPVSVGSNYDTSDTFPKHIDSDSSVPQETLQRRFIPGLSDRGCRKNVQRRTAHQTPNHRLEHSSLMCVNCPQPRVADSVPNHQFENSGETFENSSQQTVNCIRQGVAEESPNQPFQNPGHRSEKSDQRYENVGHPHGNFIRQQTADENPTQPLKNSGKMFENSSQQFENSGQRDEHLGQLFEDTSQIAENLGHQSENENCSQHLLLGPVSLQDGPDTGQLKEIAGREYFVQPDASCLDERLCLNVQKLGFTNEMADCGSPVTESYLSQDEVFI